MAVFAVGRDDRIVGVQRVDDAGRDGFLADIEVQEAADLLQPVELRAGLLETADAQHLAHELP